MISDCIPVRIGGIELSHDRAHRLVLGDSEYGGGIEIGGGLIGNIIGNVKSVSRPASERPPDRHAQPRRRADCRDRETEYPNSSPMAGATGSHLGQVSGGSIGFQLIKISSSRLRIFPRLGNVCPDGQNIARLGNRDSKIIVGCSIGSGDFGQVGSGSIGFQLIKIGSPARIFPGEA